MESTGKRFRKRDAILEFLRHSDQHPSAETIYTQLKTEIPDLSLGTVYRNLNLFKEQGLIRSLGSVNGVERFDGVTKPHVHFICQQCGSVCDLGGIEVPQSLCTQAASEVGASVEECMLTFFGICHACRAQEAQPIGLSGRSPSRSPGNDKI